MRESLGRYIKKSVRKSHLVCVRRLGPICALEIGARALKLPVGGDGRETVRGRPGDAAERVEDTVCGAL
jgi:hypothetical protein